MVNRPGRSKGCITCRRRKVKCDEGRPLCTRCAKSGNKCEGYQENQPFVWVDPKSSGPKQSSSKTEASSTSKTAGAIASTQTFSVQPTSAAHQEAFFAVIDPTVLQNFVYSALPPALGQHAFRESIYQTHLFQHLLGYTETGRDSAVSIPIMNSEDLSRDSVNALAMTFLGRIHRLPDISHQGDLLYSKAILQLAEKLNAGNEALSTPVLRAILSLAIHEVVNCSAYNGWIQHVGGIERLIETRGPWRHQSPDEQVLFEACRPLIIAKALSEQKRTFLEQRDWQDVPWALNPGLKTHQSRIFDVLSFIPGLFEDLTKLNSAATPSKIGGLSPETHSALPMSEQQRSIQITTNAHLSFLQQWYQTWSTTYQDAVQTIASPLQFSTLNAPYPLQLFGTPLLFSSLLRATEYTLYHLAIFLLLTIASQISLPSSSSQAHQTDPTDMTQKSVNVLTFGAPTNFEQQRRQAAIEICKVIPYHLQFDLHAYSGAYLLCFPLNILLGIKGARSEEGKWMAQVLADIESNWGIMAGDAWLSRSNEEATKGKGPSVQVTGEDW